MADLDQIANEVYFLTIILSEIEEREIFSNKANSYFDCLEMSLADFDFFRTFCSSYTPLYTEAVREGMAGFSYNEWVELYFRVVTLLVAISLNRGDGYEDSHLDDKDIRSILKQTEMSIERDKVLYRGCIHPN